jgi:hypothetical protein
MDIPDSVAFTDGNASRPQDGYYLHGQTVSGQHVSVQILQSDIPDLQNAGRLLFNRQLVEVRSLEEARIIRLLTSAEFADDLSSSVDYVPGPITQSHALERIRNSISVTFSQTNMSISPGTAFRSEFRTGRRAA